MKDRWVWRSRWAAVGAAIAVSIGGGGVFLASAALNPAESTVVPVTPARVLDTRDPVNVGLAGPFVSPVSQKLQITGSVPTTGGTTIVVPTGATGVLLNVTAVGPTANGFISIRPGDAAGAPATSSLNVETGSNLPNAVQVALPTTGANAGKIDITYDAYGTAGPTTELLIDVVGYMTNAGLQELVKDIPTVVYSGGNQNEAVTTTPEILRTVTLVPPSNGTVLVQSNANSDNDAAQQTQCSITTGTSNDANFNQWVGGGDANFNMLSGLRGYVVQAGVPLTVNLVCLATVGTAFVFDSNLAATFYASDGAVAISDAAAVVSGEGEGDGG